MEKEDNKQNYYETTWNVNWDIKNIMLRIAGIIPDGVVNAPGGISYTIFAQGCPHQCPGCHNPETHDYEGGEAWTVAQLIEDIKNYPLSKRVTFTGGDPFFQPDEFWCLGRELKNKRYTLVAYSGYYFEELYQNPKHKALLELLDILIDGPFIQSQKYRWLNFRGSSNQRILDVKASISRGMLVHLPKYYEGALPETKRPNSEIGPWLEGNR